MKKKELSKVELREKIQGKPYFGLWWHACMIINGCNEKEVSEIFMRNCADHLKKKIPPQLVLRQESIIYRPPYYAQPLIQNATIALKGILWGRAFEVMRFFKKGKQRFKKVYRCGKRKQVKVFRH